jgi:hypothetical protein
MLYRSSKMPALAAVGDAQLGALNQNKKDRRRLHGLHAGDAGLA